MILLVEKCGKGRRNSLSKVGNSAARAELPRIARHGVVRGTVYKQ